MTPEDYTTAFAAGAQWWAERELQAFDAAAVVAEAAALIASGFSAAEGTRPAGCPGRAFVQGAKWQEVVAEGASMWPSDQRIAEGEAERRYQIEAQP